MSIQTQGADGAGTFDHEFKSAPSVFYPAARGEKMFEYRRDDRGGYEVGQTVRLRCYDAGSATYLPEPPLDRRITNILRGGEFELPQGYCILSLAPLADGAGTKTAGEEPRIFKDGDAWCCLLGENLQDGIAGFGKTPDAARRNFRERLTGNLCSVLRGALTVADENLREIARDVTGADWLLEQEAEGRGPLAVIKRALELSPAPAATPGVPDSVRALSEAATQGAWVFERMHDDFVGVYSDDRTGSVIANFAGFHAAPRPKAEQDANARFAAEAVNHVRALIAAQPAGQSEDAAERCIACAEPLKAGERVLSDASGGIIHAACCGPERESYTGANDEALGPNDPIPQGYVYEGEQPTGQERPDRKWVCNGDPAQPARQAGDAGADVAEWKERLERAFYDAGGFHGQMVEYAARTALPVLLAAIKSAPNSPRTGATETEVREAVSKALHDNQFLDGWPEMVDPVVEAVLAARPEAPSDAGWNFDMEAAPRDGTPINVGRDNGCGWDLLVVWWSKSATEYPWHTEGGGEYPEHRFDCWATLTPPSDPAPSGQAEG